MCLQSHLRLDFRIFRARAWQQARRFPPHDTPESLTLILRETHVAINPNFARNTRCDQASDISPTHKGEVTKERPPL
jgi:hypothetical protein